MSSKDLRDRCKEEGIELSPDKFAVLWPKWLKLNFHICILLCVVYMSTTNLLIIAAAGAGIYLWMNMPRQAGPVLPPRVADIPVVQPTPTVVVKEKKVAQLPREGRIYFKDIGIAPSTSMRMCF
jgi:hypothetical protein